MDTHFCENILHLSSTALTPVNVCACVCICVRVRGCVHRCAYLWTCHGCERVRLHVYLPLMTYIFAGDDVHNRTLDEHKPALSVSQLEGPVWLGGGACDQMSALA